MTALLLLGIVGQTVGLDLKVEGEGYLRFAFEGRIVYARSAKLIVRDGRLSTASGAGLMPMVQAPAGSSKLGAETDGRLFAIVGGQRKELGRVALALFVPGEALTSRGEFSIAKSRPRLEYPGEGGAGTIAPRNLTTTSISNSAAAKPGTEAILATISIPAKVELDGGRMTLDRMVGSSPPNVLEKLKSADFGPIPSAGFPTKITRARILAKLQFVGVPLQGFRIDIPDVVEVLCVGQTIEGARFVETALSAIAEKLGQAVELKIEGDVLPLTAPKGELSLKAENIQQRDKTILATIAVFVDGRRITAKQLTFSGEQAAIAIKANELVKVILRANGVAIETTGRVRRSGRIGEIVEVEVVLTDTLSRSTHMAKVVGPGLVEVKI